MMAHQRPHQTGTARYPRLATLAAAGVLCTALVACTNGDKGHAADPAPSSAAPSPTLSVTARQEAEKDALAAYNGMMAAWVLAARTSNADDPHLSTYAYGGALQQITGDLSKKRAALQVTKGNPVYGKSVRVTAIKPASHPSEINLRDCLDGSNWLVYHASGGKVDNEPGGKHLAVVIVKDVGSWKVADFAIHGVGTCT